MLPSPSLLAATRSVHALTSKEKLFLRCKLTLLAKSAELFALFFLLPSPCLQIPAHVCLSVSLFLSLYFCLSACQCNYEELKWFVPEYLQFLAPVPSSLPAVPGPARLDQPALPQSLQAAQVQPASQPETTVKVISVPKVQQGQARVDHSLASQSQQQQDEGVVRQDPFQPPSATATSDQSALHLEHDLQEPAELVQSFNAWRLHHQQQESPDVAEVQQEILRETTNSTKTVGADSPQRSVGN